MRNVLFEGYNALDAMLVKSINVGVKAYNWTTGGTKFELAKNLSMTAPVLESIGFINDNPIVALTLLTPFYLFLSHIDQKKFEEIDKAERRAFETNALNLAAENEKNYYCRFNGCWWLLGGSCDYSISSHSFGYFIQDKTGTDKIQLTGTTIRAISHYVMRVDYLPPRKSCVKRGLEHLAQWYEATKAQPVAAPVPVALQFSMLSGGDI